MNARSLVAVVLAAVVTAMLGAASVAAKPAAGTCNDPAGCVILGPGAPVRIGSLVVSDLVAPLGRESARAVELAVAARGSMVAGHPIQLTHLADGCEPGLATTTATSVASDATFVAILGTTCSRAARPVAPIFGSSGIVLISPSNTAPDLTDPGTRDPFYFRLAYNDGHKAAAVASFLRTAGHDTAAVVVEEGPGIAGMGDHFAARFEAEGGTVTDHFVVPASQDDFSAELATIAGSLPDVIFFVVIGNGPAFVGQARAEAGLAGTLLASTEDVVTEAFVADVGTDAEGIVFGAPDFGFLEVEPYVSDLRVPYEAAYDEKPETPFHAYAFDATNRLLDAIQSFRIGGSRQLTIPRTALRDAFAATSGYAGVSGTVTCDADGDCHATPFLILMVDGGVIVPA